MNSAFDTVDDLKPYPACPDGGVWDSNGPTSKTCPVCAKGHAVVHLNGSPLTKEEANAQ